MKIEGCPLYGSRGIRSKIFLAHSEFTKRNLSVIFINLPFLLLIPLELSSSMFEYKISETQIHEGELG